MRCRIALMLMLPLAGCTNDRAVVPVLDQGGILFTARENRDGGRNCLRRIEIRDHRRAAVWAIENPTARCVVGFPLRYGVAPAGFVTLTAARRLDMGETYSIHGEGQGVLRGVFVYRGPAGTPIVHATGTQQWCDGQWPRTHPDWTGQCISDNANDVQ